MVLKNVENRLERIFERTFSRPFKTSLQPIEIGTRIVREVDLTRQTASEVDLAHNSRSDLNRLQRRLEGSRKRALKNPLEAVFYVL